MARRGTTEAQTRIWVRDVVRSGLLTPEEEYAEVAGVVGVDHPRLDAAVTAREWIADEHSQWEADAGSWPEPTDHERLEAAFVAIRAAGILVLAPCVDHWAARDALRADPSAAGVAWFRPEDVWHAIDEPMLEINLWHPSTANAAPGDQLLDDVLALVREQGLSARFEEGRVEVAARWQRRPAESHRKYV